MRALSAPMVRWRVYLATLVQITFGSVDTNSDPTVGVAQMARGEGQEELTLAAFG